MTLEVNLEDRCCRLLAAHGADAVKRGQGGELDREVFWGGGLHFWVEFKKAAAKGDAGGRLRVSQKTWIKFKMPRGDQHYVVDTFEQMEEIIAIWEMSHGPATAK